MLEYVELITTVGFPISACIYFALRFEKILQNNTNAINQNCKLIEQMCIINKKKELN